jgi:hypothetical protein
MNAAFIWQGTWKWAIAWDLREMRSVWGKGARVGQAPYNTSIKVLILIIVISFRIINLLLVNIML